MSLDNIAEVIFNNRKSRTLVIGPDAFAVDRGELGFHDDKDFETVYDMLVDELIKQSGQAVTRPHDTHDLFVATEIFLANNGYKQSLQQNLYIQFFQKYRDLRLSIIDTLIELPFDYIINFGFDDYLSERVKSMRPRARVFNIIRGEKLKRWPKKKSHPGGTVESPWIINLLGSPSDATATYPRLMELFSDVLRPDFLHPAMRNQVANGAVLYLGMQLRHWYTRVLMLLLRLPNQSMSGDRRALEMRSPLNSAEAHCIELYAQNTTNTEVATASFDDVYRLLRELHAEFHVRHVFISHRFVDRQRMVEIRDALKEAVNIIVVTSDDFQRDGGEPWWPLVEKAIQSSSIYLQCITENYRNHDGSVARREREIARSEQWKGTYIPITYDGLNLDEVISDDKDINPVRADMDSWLEDLINRICDVIDIEQE
ncbi:MAG: toll/interleukin-1 receptor domain-containing protein [Pseudomonadota bacterium]